MGAAGGKLGSALYQDPELVLPSAGSAGLEPILALALPGFPRAKAPVEATSPSAGRCSICLCAGLGQLPPFPRLRGCVPRGGPGRGYDYAVSWAMPAGELLALAVPEYAGALEDNSGANPHSFAATRVCRGHRAKAAGAGLRVCAAKPLLVVFSSLGVFLTIALGGDTPLYRVYYEVLPGRKVSARLDLFFYGVAVARHDGAAITLSKAWLSGRGCAGRLDGRRGAGGGARPGSGSRRVSPRLLEGALTAVAPVPPGVDFVPSARFFVITLWTFIFSFVLEHA